MELEGVERNDGTKPALTPIQIRAQQIRLAMLQVYFDSQALGFESGELPPTQVPADVLRGDLARMGKRYGGNFLYSPKALMRQCCLINNTEGDQVLRVGPFTLDPVQMIISTPYASPHEVGLTPTEGKIARSLMMNAGRYLPYSRLTELIWGSEAKNLNSLKTYVSRLREKIGDPKISGHRGDQGHEFHHIQTKFGVGYGLFGDPQVPSRFIS